MDSVFSELSGSLVWRSLAVVDVARRWNAPRSFARLSALHSSAGSRSLATHVDEADRHEPRAHPLVLCLRHHPLPLDGCGYHLQARPGLHGGYGGSANVVFSLVAPVTFPLPAP